MSTAYIIFAHGSSIESANQAVRDVAAEVARRGGLEIVEAAFLEGGKPDLAAALETVASQVSRVVVVPYFLTLGLHLQRDLPLLIRDIKAAHPGLTIEVTPPLDQHPALVDALLDRGSPNMNARLIESKEIAPFVRHFVFEPDGGALEYLPGQFVSFMQRIGDKDITRAYSIASAPRGDSRFELCLNLVEGGHLTPYLFKMRPGDKIQMTTPLGQFVLRDPPRDSILIATGTGIAPFRAFLEAHLRESSPAFTLIFGVRNHVLYGSEFEALSAVFPHFRFWPTLSRPDASWAGRKGHVQTHLEEAIGGRRDVDFYLCGLKAMVDDVRGILKGMGFDRKQIRYEKYD